MSKLLFRLISYLLNICDRTLYLSFSGTSIVRNLLIAGSIEVLKLKLNLNLSIISYSKLKLIYRYIITKAKQINFAALFS